MDNTKKVNSQNNDEHFWRRFPYLLIAFGAIIPLFGKVLFIGPILVAFAPNFLLAGISLLIVVHLFSQEEPGKRISFFLLFCVVLGLNTRIPSIVHDMLNREERQHVSAKLPLSVGDSIYLDSNVIEISARHFSYAGTQPNCNEGFCAAITGYYPPATFLGIDYWKENPAQSIKSFGFSMASKNQNVPTFRIRANEEGNLLRIDFELLDNTGKQISSERKIYRNGFPFESRDLDGKGSGNQQLLWVAEYLLHGNMVSSIIGKKFGYSQASPAGYFLNSSIRRYVQQDDQSLTQQLKPQIENVKEVNLIDQNELWDDKIWDAIFFDSERSNACKAFVQPDNENNAIAVHDFTVAPGIQSMGKARTPFKFLRDQDGEKKLLIRGGGLTLCEGDYLFLIDHPNSIVGYKQFEISKYKYDGTFIYRAAFDMPLTAAGFVGGISPTSFKESNGEIKFDYVDFVMNGQTRSIKQIRSMVLHAKQRGAAN